MSTGATRKMILLTWIEEALHHFIVETTLTAILETRKWWKESLIQQNQVLKFPEEWGHLKWEIWLWNFQFKNLNSLTDFRPLRGSWVNTTYTIQQSIKHSISCLLKSMFNLSPAASRTFPAP